MSTRRHTWYPAANYQQGDYSVNGLPLDIPPSDYVPGAVDDRRFVTPMPSLTVYGGGPQASANRPPGRPTAETPTTFNPLAGLVGEWWNKPFQETDATSPAAAGLPGGTEYLDTPMATAVARPTVPVTSAIDSPDSNWVGAEAATPSGGGRSPNLIDNPDEAFVGTEPSATPAESATPSSSGRSPTFIDNPDNAWVGSAPERRTQSSGGRGIDSFGNNLTLGEYLNTPLSSLHYGEGYPPVSGGDVTIGSPGNQTTTHTPGEPGSTEGTTPVAGAIQTDPITGQPYDFNAIPEPDGPPRPLINPVSQQPFGNQESQMTQGYPWYDPRYQLSPGIRAAIERGDYATAYGMNPSQAEDLNLMQQEHSTSSLSRRTLLNPSESGHFYSGIWRLGDTGPDYVGSRIPNRSTTTQQLGNPTARTR